MVDEDHGSAFEVAAEASGVWPASGSALIGALFMAFIGLALLIVGLATGDYIKPGRADERPFHLDSKAPTVSLKDFAVEDTSAPGRSNEPPHEKQEIVRASGFVLEASTAMTQEGRRRPSRCL